MPFNEKSTLKQIMGNEAAKAVIEKHLPGFWADPSTKQAMGMSLKVICSFPQAKPLKEKLSDILADLAVIE